MKLLTVAMVAEMLAVSKSLVYALVNRGELPFVTVGTSKGYRFDLDDVKSFIHQRKQTKTGAKSKTPRPRLKHIRL